MNFQISRPSLPPLPSHQRGPGLSDFSWSIHHVFMGTSPFLMGTYGKTRETMGTSAIFGKKHLLNSLQPAELLDDLTFEDQLT